MTPAFWDQNGGVKHYGDTTGLRSDPGHPLASPGTLKLQLANIPVRHYQLVKCEKTIPEDELMFLLSKNGFVGGFRFKVEKI